MDYHNSQEHLKGQTCLKMSLYEAMVLIVNVLKASKNKEVGYEDCNETLSQMRKSFNYEVIIPLRRIESALWSCNLLDEKKEFWHPDEASFDEFLKVFSKYKFNKKMNLLELRDWARE